MKLLTKEFKVILQMRWCHRYAAWDQRATRYQHSTARTVQAAIQPRSELRYHLVWECASLDVRFIVSRLVAMLHERLGVVGWPSVAPHLHACQSHLMIATCHRFNCCSTHHHNHNALKSYLNYCSVWGTKYFHYMDHENCNKVREYT